MKLVNLRYLGQKASVMELGIVSRLLVRGSEDGLILAFLSIWYKIYFTNVVFLFLNFIRFSRPNYKSFFYTLNIIPLIKSNLHYIQSKSKHNNLRDALRRSPNLTTGQRGRRTNHFTANHSNPSRVYKGTYW